MKFTVVKEPIPFLIIDDTYNREEQIQIYNELDFLMDKLEGPEHTGSALNNGERKNNVGVFLESAYSDRNLSNILTNNRKLFCDEVKDKIFECHPAYGLLNNTNNDHTLVSYYGDGGSYFSHKDLSAITIVTWFFKSPKNFTGGEFKFTDYNLDIEVKNNRSVMFFSCYPHEVTNVNIIDDSVPGSGRFTISNFLHIVPRNSVYDNKKE